MSVINKKELFSLEYNTCSGYGIGKYKGDEKDVVIPCEIDGHPITWIARFAFRNNKTMESVVIPESVELICREAFSDCSALKTVTLKSKRLEICEFAFSNCKSHRQFVFPKDPNIEYKCNGGIASRDLSYFRFLSKGSYCSEHSRKRWAVSHWFNGDREPTDEVEVIEAYIVERRNELLRYSHECTIKNGEAVFVRKLLEYCYEQRFSLKVLDNAIEAYKNNVEITAMLLDYKHKVYTSEEIEKYERSKLNKSLRMTPILEDWKKIFRVEREDDGYVIKGFKQNEDTLFIPSVISKKPVIGVSGGACFQEAPKASKVILPDTIKTIGEKAFSGYRQLTEIEIPQSVKLIGNSAFGCSGLERIAIPEGAEEIGHSAFQHCERLTEVILPTSLKRMRAYAFDNCIELTGITIPGGVKEIEAYSFYECKKLQTVVIENGVVAINENVFTYCSALESIVIPPSVVYIDRGAFRQGVTIYGKRGSYAEVFAEFKGVKFETIE